MVVTILGSGTIISSKLRNPAANLLEHNGNYALVDCGPGCLRSLVELPIDVLKIEVIFITHFHLDHCSDVLALLMRRYLLDEHSNSRVALYGPIGLQEWFATSMSLQGGWLKDHQPKIVELDRPYVLWQNIKVTVCQTLHTENSIAYKFKSRERSLFISGDAGYSEDLANFAGNSDVAVIECSYSDEKEMPNHMTPEKVARFINEANIKQTILTHIYPENDTADLLERVQKHTRLQVTTGFDLMKVSL